MSKARDSWGSGEVLSSLVNLKPQEFGIIHRGRRYAQPNSISAAGVSGDALLSRIV